MDITSVFTHVHVHVHGDDHNSVSVSETPRTSSFRTRAFTAGHVATNGRLISDRELYYDRPAADWFDADGKPVLKAVPLEPASLLDEEPR